MENGDSYLGHMSRVSNFDVKMTDIYM